jgi:hypothetical protein
MNLRYLKWMILCMSLPAYAQVSFFNEVYINEALGSSLHQVIIEDDTSFVSVGYGGPSLEDDGVYLRRVNHSGVELDVNLFSLPYPASPNDGEAFVLLDNGDFIMSCGTDNLVLVRCNAELDTIWTQLIPGWLINDIGYIVGVMEMINSTEFVIISVPENSNESDLYHLRLTTCSVDGIVVDDVMLPGLSVSIGLGGSLILPNNDLLLWGSYRQWDNWNDTQLFMYRINIDGDSLGFYSWGNADDCRDRGPHCTLINENTVAVSYGLCTEFISTFDNMCEDHLMYFDVATMLPVSDVPRSISYLQNSHTTVAYMDSEKSVDGGLVSLVFERTSNIRDTCFVIKTDAGGIMQWYKQYYPEIEPAIANNVLYDIKPTQDGGYVMSGECVLLEGGQYNWIVKIDSCGYELPGACYPDLIEEQQIMVNLWPNPAHDYLKAILPFNAHIFFVPQYSNSCLCLYVPLCASVCHCVPSFPQRQEKEA